MQPRQYLLLCKFKNLQILKDVYAHLADTHITYQHQFKLENWAVKVNQYLINSLT